MVTKPFSLMVIAALAMLWVWVFYARLGVPLQRPDVLAQGAGRRHGDVLRFRAHDRHERVASPHGGLTGGFLLCVGHSVVRAPEPPPEGDAEAQGIVGGFTEAVSGAAKSGYCN